MASRAAKFVPVGLVAGAMGYLCWPYLPTPVAPTSPKKAGDVSELTSQMLAPPPFAALERDPFGMSTDAAAPQLSATPKSGILATLSKADKLPRRSMPPSGEAPDALVLHGTYVRGNHRVALINQAVYREGDQITLEELGGATCRVAEINLDKVVLDLNGELAELSYPIFSASPPPLNPQERLPFEEATVPVATADDSQEAD